MNVGVLAAQGDIEEHRDAVRRAMKSLGIKGEAHRVTGKDTLDKSDAMVIPGGESTTISKLIQAAGIYDTIIKRVKSGMPLLGTCAGSILLAKKGGKQVLRTKTVLLGLMDIQIDRNAYGGQRESFESEIKISGFTKPYHAIFIRAPRVLKYWGGAKVLGFFDKSPVIIRQGNVFAVTFHPELSQDTRVHELFLKSV